ncbi:MAG: ATP-binding cassette domain-containing protein [Chitinophagaceae bacterium]|nr:ATP-binding cassette domain-containing protein [Chitinophagaceae bacterium]
MRLSIHRLIPHRLKEKVNALNSWVWDQELTFNQGEQILIQAPSGAGKTLLMNMLYGMDKDYDGEVHWSVYNMKKTDAVQLSKLRAVSIAMVFQDLKLFSDLTVKENIELKRSITDSVTEYETEKWLEKLGLKREMDTELGTLSYGEQQRVAIVRALAQPFEWLLMDEAFSHLDNFNKQRAATLIKEVRARTDAGMIFADVENNDHFTYDKKLLL